METQSLLQSYITKLNKSIFDFPDCFNQSNVKYEKSVRGIEGWIYLLYEEMLNKCPRIQDLDKSSAPIQTYTRSVWNEREFASVSETSNLSEFRCITNTIKL